MENEVELGPTRPWPLIQALFWTVETVLGLGTFVAGFVLMADGEPWQMVATLIAAGALLAYLGLAMAGLCWITTLARGPVLVMSAAGLRDLRVSPDLIPWEGFDWGVFYAGRGRTSIQFATSAPVRVGWPMRMFAPLSRVLRTPPYFIMSLGTGHSVDDLTFFLHRFREARY
jgi:hypothetical protein